MSSIGLAFSLASASPGCAFWSGDASAEYTIQRWTVEHGLPENTVTAIVQTRDGYLWIGSWNGLARFDGARFVRFGLAEGLKTTSTYLLREDLQGDLWIGTYDSGVSRYRGGRFEHFTREHGLPSDLVNSLAEDGDGNLWTGCSRGVGRWDGQRFVPEWPGGLESTNQSWSVVADPAGTIWANAAGGDAWRRRNGQWEALAGASRTTLENSILFFTRDGRLWRRLNLAQLARLENGAWQIVSDESGLAKSFCCSALEQRDGSLMIGTYEDGLFRYQNDRASLVAFNEAPRKDAVLALCEDREGNLWTGTRTFGLARLRTRRVHVVPGTDKVRRIRSVAFDPQGRTWLASEEGLFELREGSPVAVDLMPLGKRLFSVWCVAPAVRGVWVGAGFGVVHHDPEATPAWRRVWYDARPTDRERAFVWSLAGDGQGGVWFGTGDGRLGHAQADGVQLFCPSEPRSRGGESAHSPVPENERRLTSATTVLSLPPSLADKKIVALLRESTGALWVGSEGGGLHRMENDRITLSLTTRDGLPTDSIRCLHQDAEGTLWIGTFGGGLVRYRDGKLFTFAMAQGLPDGLISAILEDHDGQLWCAATPGFFRLDKRALDDVAAGRASGVHPLLVGASEGLVESEPIGGSTPNGVRGAEGILFFPTVRGLIALNPANFRRSTEPPLLRIEEARIDGQPAELSADTRAALRVPPGGAPLDIHYTAFHFAAPETLRFRHRLDRY